MFHLRSSGAYICSRRPALHADSKIMEQKGTTLINLTLLVLPFSHGLFCIS